MIGKGYHQALVSLMERKSRLSLIAKVERKRVDMVSTGVSRVLKPLGLPLHPRNSDKWERIRLSRGHRQALNANSSLLIPMPHGNEV